MPISPIALIGVFLLTKINEKKLGPGVFCLVLSALLYLTVEVIVAVYRYTQMYSTLSDVALERSRWRQLAAIFQNLTLKDVPWQDVLGVAILKVIVWIIERFDRLLHRHKRAAETSRSVELA